MVLGKRKNEINNNEMYNFDEGDSLINEFMKGKVK